MCNSVLRGNQEKVQCTVQCHPSNGVSGTHMTQPGLIHPDEFKWITSSGGCILLIAWVLETTWSHLNTSFYLLNDLGEFVFIGYEWIRKCSRPFALWGPHYELNLNLRENGLSETCWLKLGKWQPHSRYMGVRIGFEGRDGGPDPEFPTKWCDAVYCFFFSGQSSHGPDY